MKENKFSAFAQNTLRAEKNPFRKTSVKEVNLIKNQYILLNES